VRSIGKAATIAFKGGVSVRRNGKSQRDVLAFDFCIGEEQSFTREIDFFFLRSRWIICCAILLIEVTEKDPLPVTESIIHLWARPPRVLWWPIRIWLRSLIVFPLLCVFLLKIEHFKWDGAGIAQSVYQLVTGCTVRGSNPGRGEIFRTRSGRPWGPPSLLCYGYRFSFPGVKRPGRGVEHPPPSSSEIKERVQLYPYFPSGPSWQVIGWTLRFNGVMSHPGSMLRFEKVYFFKINFDFYHQQPQILVSLNYFFSKANSESVFASFTWSICSSFYL
jgi:hypothetical protein